jgi:hypothetical protein
MHTLQLVLTLGMYVEVSGLYGTDSSPWAHLERGNEHVGGANSLAPRSVINFLLGS